MNKFFTDDKAPYFFTLLVGLIAFQFNHVVAYILETPTVAYSYNVSNKDITGDIVTEEVELKIENINRKLGFNNLTFYVKYRSPINKDTASQVYDPTLIAIAPAEILPDTVVASQRQKLNQYRITNLQPGGIYLATFITRHRLDVDELPKVYLNSSNTVLLTQANFETYLVKNQFCINIILLCFWIFLIIIYAIKLLLNIKNN